VALATGPNDEEEEEEEGGGWEIFFITVVQDTEIYNRKIQVL